jgi:uncharacterized membrane protein
MDQIFWILFGLFIGYVVLKGAITFISWIEKIEDKDE